MTVDEAVGARLHLSRRNWPATTPRSARRLSARHVTRVALILITLQLALRAWVGYRGYFFLDDFAFTGRAAHYSLTDVHSYLLHSYNSHLMPGAFAEVWVLTALWPLNFVAVTTFDLLLQVAVGVAFYALLRELFGARPVVLVPLAVYLFTPITLPAAVWWAAALNQLPQQLAMITALWCQVRYLRTGRVRTGVFGALALGGGLLFSEKTILTVPLLAALTVLWFTGGGIWQRLWQGWRAHWRVWLAYLAVTIPYAGYYVATVPSPGRAVGRGDDVVQLLGSSFGHALLPGLLGGPWSWHQVGFAGALADPGHLQTYLSVVVVAAIVIASIAWHRQAVLGWALAGGYALLTLAVLATSRATFIGPLIGDEYRYVTDVAVVAVLGASLAMIRPHGAWVHPPVRLQRRAWVGQLDAVAAVRDVREALPRVRPRAVMATLTVLVVASATVSTVRYDRYWSINPARPYVSHLSADLAAAPAGLVVYDQIVPAEVAWALLYPYNLLSNLTLPLRDRPRFLTTGHGADSLAITDSAGFLRRADIVGIAALPGPVANGCGWLLGPQPVDVRLTQRTYGWTWIVHLAYIASADATATMHAGTTTARVQLHAGLHELFVQVVGAIDQVSFDALPGGITACTSDLTVGQPTAEPGTRP